MEMIIHNNGKQIGPFPEARVAEMLKAGEIAGTDLAWSEGMKDWQPLFSFSQFQTGAGGPPPIPREAPAVSPARKTEPLSIWSLVLGIVSIVGCSVGGFLAGIPAVICGHVGMSRIKKDPSLDGKGMALAGLITGYIGLLVFIPAILFALALPAVIAAKDRAKATRMLTNMRQIQVAMEQATLDGKFADNFTSKAEVKKMLTGNNYLTDEDLARFQFDKISVGNVATEDPPNTIVLQSRSDNGKLTITVLKSGEGQITRAGQPPPGQPPPRSPAFLN